ncbi:hypothetical protein CPB84DRAFT_1674206, partial [Gymnopilus junonius]
VIGPTGAGKSTFINCLLPKDSDQRMIVNHGLASSVDDPKAAEIASFSSHPRVKGRRLLLLDTPGFDDTLKDDTMVLTSIANLISNQYCSYSTVLGGVIYLHDITVDRLSAAASRSLQILDHLCGSKVFRNVVLVTTKWNRETPDRHCERHELELRDNYWKPLITQGSSMERFQEESDASKFVDLILSRTSDHGIVLDIQKEMVDERKSVSETKAGKTSKRQNEPEKGVKLSFFRRIRRFFFPK